MTSNAQSNEQSNFNTSSTNTQIDDFEKSFSEELSVLKELQEESEKLLRMATEEHLFDENHEKTTNNTRSFVNKQNMEQPKNPTTHTTHTKTPPKNTETQQSKTNKAMNTSKNHKSKKGNNEKFEYLKKGQRWGNIQSKISYKKPTKRTKVDHSTPSPPKPPPKPDAFERLPQKPSPKQDAFERLPQIKPEQLKKFNFEAPVIDNEFEKYEREFNRVSLHADQIMSGQIPPDMMYEPEEKSILSEIIDMAAKPKSYATLYMHKNVKTQSSSPKITSTNVADRAIEQISIYNKKLKELERERKKFEKEKEEFRIKCEKETQKFKEFKEKELERIRKLKRVQERRSRANSQFTKRFDRDKEIITLKKRIEELLNLNKTETRRMREENEKLKKEIQFLEQRNEQLIKELKKRDSPKVTNHCTNTFKEDFEEENEKQEKEIKESLKKLQKTISSTIGVQLLDSDDDDIVLHNEESISLFGKPIKNSNRYSFVCNSVEEEQETEKPSHLAPLEFELAELHEMYKVDDSEEEPIDNLGPMIREINLGDGKKEIQYMDRVEIVYPNGTIKKIFKNGFISVFFSNGDIKKTFLSGKVAYYYNSAKTTHTSYPNGLQVYLFANNQIEKHYPNGTKEIIFPDKTLKLVRSNGEEDIYFPDGTYQHISPEKKVTRFSDGHIESEMIDGSKKVEYVNGITKIKYPDGKEITTFPDQRRRIKNSNGEIIIE